MGNGSGTMGMATECPACEMEVFDDDAIKCPACGADLGRVRRPSDYQMVRAEVEHPCMDHCIGCGGRLVRDNGIATCPSCDKGPDR